MARKVSVKNLTNRKSRLEMFEILQFTYQFFFFENCLFERKNDIATKVKQIKFLKL